MFLVSKQQWKACSIGVKYLILLPQIKTKTLSENKYKKIYGMYGWVFKSIKQNRKPMTNWYAKKLHGKEIQFK